MFTAKVKSNGGFFMAQFELPECRDAHKLESGKRYGGQFFDSIPTITHYIE